MNVRTRLLLTLTALLAVVGCVSTGTDVGNPGGDNDTGFVDDPTDAATGGSRDTSQDDFDSNVGPAPDNGGEPSDDAAGMADASLDSGGEATDGLDSESDASDASVDISGDGDGTDNSDAGDTDVISTLDASDGSGSEGSGSEGSGSEGSGSEGSGSEGSGAEGSGAEGSAG